jgi:hypothetical protein
VGNLDAIKMVKLGLVKGLPGLYCEISNCAHTASENLIQKFRTNYTG